MTDATTVMEFGPLLADIESRVRDADYSSTLNDLMPQMAQQEAGMFAGGFDSNLVSWPGLKPSTIKRKGHDRILVKLGALRESLVHPGGDGNINEVASRGMLYGTEVECAFFHQEGTCRMPARLPVGLLEELLDKLREQIADSTVEQLKG